MAIGLPNRLVCRPMLRQDTQSKPEPVVGAGIHLGPNRLGVETPAAGPIEAEPLGLLARRLYAAQCRSKHRTVHRRLSRTLRMRFPMINHLQRAWTFGRRHASTVR